MTPHHSHNYNCNCDYTYTTLIALHYNYNSITLQLHLLYTLHPAVVLRWPLQSLQPLQKTQLQPPFGPSVDSLCHPWFTTTNLSHRFPKFWNFRRRLARYYWYIHNRHNIHNHNNNSSNNNNMLAISQLIGIIVRPWPTALILEIFVGFGASPEESWVCQTWRELRLRELRYREGLANVCKCMWLRLTWIYIVPRIEGEICSIWPDATSEGTVHDQWRSDTSTRPLNFS